MGKALNESAIHLSQIDIAAGRVLSAMISLGLLDPDDYQNQPYRKLGPSDVDTLEHR
jgi:hypothetical protein